MDSQVLQWVRFEGAHDIGPFCLIGQPFRGMTEDDALTTIGSDAIIRSHTVIYTGNVIGRHFQTGHHVFIRELNRIGDNVSVGTLSVIEHHVLIGNRVRLHTQVFIPEFSILEDDCWIGPNVVLTNAPYPRGSRVKAELRGARICREAKVGANATLLPGIVIGRGALVGAGSVVTKDVPEFTVVAGNPACVRGSVFDLKYDDGEQVYFQPEDITDGI
ncbi:N-acetyltransferase [bacterium]|nr:N-acetyltransferase [candidate division CSSED10-310 bacterium]